MKKLILFLIFTFLLFSTYLFSQKKISLSCKYLWIEERPISVEIFPQNQISSSFPSILNLNLSFDDLDKKSAIKSDSCSGSKVKWAESSSAKYRLKIKTQDSAYISFKLGANVDSLEKIFEYNMPSQKIPSVNIATGFYQLYQYPFQVYTKPQWKIGKKTIKIDYTITDLSTLPAKDTGNIVDQLAIGSWEIIYNDSIPCADSMISLVTNPLSTIWTVVPANIGSVDFDYAVGPDLKKDKKSDYTGTNVTEELSGPFAGGLFTMADLDSTWMVNHSYLNTEDKVADFLAKSSIGAPHMWYIINSPIHQDKFNTVDAHGSFLVDAFQDAFKEKALLDGKCGFLIKQNYKCNGTKLIGSTEIYKRYKPVISGNNIMHNREVRKVHKF